MKFLLPLLVGAILLCRNPPAFASDPFEPGSEAVIPVGTLRDRLIDTRVWRSCQHILTPPPAMPWLQPRAGERLVANVFHHGEFFVARVPEGSIEAAWLQLEHFPPEALAAHTQIRFRLNRRIELVPQRGGETAPSPEESIFVSDLTLSIEAARPHEVSYSLIRGLRPYFMTAYRITTSASEYEEAVRQGHQRVTQYEIDLTAIERERLFSSAIERGSRLGLTQIYNTLNASCTTEAFRLIDESLSGGPQTWGRLNALSQWLFTRVPVLGPTALRLRRIFQARVGDFNSEPAPIAIDAVGNSR